MLHPSYIHFFIHNFFRKIPGAKSQYDNLEINHMVCVSFIESHTNVHRYKCKIEKYSLIFFTLHLDFIRLRETNFLNLGFRKKINATLQNGFKSTICFIVI